MQISRLGENLAVVLPRSIVESHHLKEGDEVEIDIRSARSAETQTKSANPREEALQRLRELRLSPSGAYRFDREEANAR
jgi:antitoxin MazE